VLIKFVLQLFSLIFPLDREGGYTFSSSPLQHLEESLIADSWTVYSIYDAKCTV